MSVKFAKLQPYFPLDLHNPMKIAMTIPSSTFKRESKWEKKRDKLLWEKAKRISILRWILLILLRVVASVLALCIVGLFLFLLSKCGSISDVVAIALGVLGGMMLLLVWSFDYGVETDPYWIRERLK